MPITITINGTVTLDESAGLQVGGIADPPEDNNDNDVSLATVLSDAASFYNRLSALALDPANALGAARSASNYISLTGTGTITTLGFVDSSGAALPVLGGGGTGASSGLTALDGGAITMFRDDSLGSRVAYGVDADGDVVFALFMDPNAGLTSATVWMVEFEALANSVTTNHDDPLTLSGLSVGAGVSSEFNFDGLPSGANLFGMVGTAASGLIVFGENTALRANGTYTNQSDVIHTSQAGPNATIGVNNQMFDPGDGAYFTYVRGPNSNFLGFNLSSNEADDADNLLYSDGVGGNNDTIEVDSAFLRVAQTQSGGTASMIIAAFNITGSPQTEDLIDASGENAVPITRVKVYDSAGTLLDDSNNAANTNPNISFSIVGGIATVSGIEAGYKVEWFTSGLHDQVLITGDTGKFDIGGFGVNEPSSVLTPLTGVRFEDDGPDVDIELNGTAEVTVDESTLPASDFITAADLFSVNTESFGTDGPGTVSSVYKLLLADDNSGLFDTKTGSEVLLSINAAGTLITGQVNDGGLVTVFTIALDPDTGQVTLTQNRALIHPDDEDPDEADDPLTLPAELVKIQRTVTDGDGDSASDDVDISQVFKFRDDGPALPPASQAPLELRTDDTDLTPDTATLSTDVIFPGLNPNVFGSDGPNADDPIVYELRLNPDAPNNNSGLVDTETGDAILLVEENGDIVGYVDADGDGTIEAGETLEAVRYSLTEVDADTETVTFTQSRSVVHDDVDDPNEAGTPETINANLVLLDQIAIDGDDDVSNVVTFDLGAITFINDDGPDIGPIADSIVDFVDGDTATETLNGAVGNDPRTNPYILTAFTPSLVVNGVTVQGVLAANSQSVTYWANTNGNGTVGDAGDTAYYQLTLNQAGAGSYHFEVLIDPPPSFTEFTFDLLPSGANLFGVVTSGNSALLVCGEVPVFDASGNYTNASDVIHTSQGGDGATIGVNNQMFDPGDGAYFTFINDPDPNFISGAPGGLSSTEADDVDNIQYNEDGVGPATREVSSAFLGISQTQSNKPVSLTIEAFNIDGGPQEAFVAELGDNHVDITAVRVFNAAGVNVTASVSISISGGVATVGGLLRGYTVEWDTSAPHDQVLITGVSGKFDVGRFGFLQGQDTPDQLLEFTAQVTDGDGDTDEESWSIGIDGTGIHDDGSVGGISLLAAPAALELSRVMEPEMDYFKMMSRLDDIWFG